MMQLTYLLGQNFILFSLFFGLQLGTPVSSEPCGLECWLESLVVHVPDIHLNEVCSLLWPGVTLCSERCIGWHHEFHLYRLCSVWDRSISANPYFNVFGCKERSRLLCWQLEGDLEHSGWVWRCDSQCHSDTVWYGIGISEEWHDWVDQPLSCTCSTPKYFDWMYWQVASCATKLNLDAKFEGSGAIEKLAEWLFPYIKGFIQSEVQRTVCAEVTTLAETNLTSAIQSINEELLPYLDDAFTVIFLQELIFILL